MDITSFTLKEQNFYINPCTFTDGEDPTGEGKNEKARFIGDPEGEPFVVQIRSRRHIPISAIIFAKSKELAINAIIGYLEEVAQAKPWREGTENLSQVRAHNILTGRDGKETYEILVAPFDKRLVGFASWASNDTLI